MKRSFLVYTSHETRFSCLEYSRNTENLSEIHMKTRFQHKNILENKDFWSILYLKHGFMVCTVPKTQESTTKHCQKLHIGSI